MTERSEAARELLASLGERFRDTANVRVVFGEPVAAAGKTIIPVAQVAYGYGGGAAPHRHRHGESGAPEAGSADQAGGGGGVMARPAGVVEIGPEGTRFVRFGRELHLGLAFAGGLLLGLALGRRRRRD